VRLVRPVLILAALLAVAAPTAGEAAAAGGGLRFVECLTGKRPVAGEPRSPRGGGCKLSKTVAGDGEGSALNFVSALTASPDGRSLYAVSGLFTRHFRKNLIPAGADLSWKAFSGVIANHLRAKQPGEAEASSYNVLQRLTYLLVIFVLFPLVIWTGLAMSPAVASAFPAAVTVFGGQQSARTIHFFVSVLLVLFVLVHVVMVSLTGFRHRLRAMISGVPAATMRSR